MASPNVEDYSAAHSSLAVLLDRTATFLMEQGVPAIGSPNAVQPPLDDARAWDVPPADGQENFYGLLAMPPGYPKSRGSQVAIADAAPSRFVEMNQLNLNVHRMVPDAAGTLALGTTLTIVYASPYYPLDQKGAVTWDTLPQPATCTFSIRNPRVQGWDRRDYVIKETPKRDELRPDRGVDFDLDATRVDRRDDGTVRLGTMATLPLMTQREAEMLREVVDLLPALPDENWVRRMLPKQV
ncbi:MAG TPA: hypothetical protein VLF62_05075 [Candidatus Saccharimonadales bacterium]|nr:hypothetical protein [Candidatus Saccharimonadales bacterium]